MIQFGNGNFSFGPLSGVTQGLFETNHDIAFQRFADWAGQNNFNFGGTNAGRWLQQQQGAWNNRFVDQQAQQTERFAQGKLDWDAQQKAQLAAYNAQKAQALQAMADTYRAWDGIIGSPTDAARMAAREAWGKLSDNPYKVQEWTAPEEQLTWAKFLEQNQGDITGGFNQLTGAMRGANPGAFQIRRNLW